MVACLIYGSIGPLKFWKAFLMRIQFRIGELILIILMKAEYMAMHACLIGPTDTAPPCLGSHHQGCVGTRGNSLRQETFLPPFLHSILVGVTTLFHLDPWLCCYWLPSKVDVDQSGLSSFSIAGLLLANT